MEQKMDQKKKKYAVIICVCALAALAAIGTVILAANRVSKDGNLSLIHI